MFINLKWFFLILACSWVVGRLGLRSLKWTCAIVGLAFTRSPFGFFAGLFLGYLFEGVFQRPKVHFHYERTTFHQQPFGSQPVQPGFIPDAVMSAYQTLGISPDATDDEVRQAYRRMAMKYHPDRFASQGEDMRARAERLFKLVGDAKERIFRYRGIK